MTETKETLAADETTLAEVKSDCEAKAKEWAMRQKQAGEETAAIEKAKEVLAEGVKVFLQTSTKIRKSSVDEALYDTRTQVCFFFVFKSPGRDSELVRKEITKD